MKNYIYNPYKLLLGAIALMLIVTSCKPYDDFPIPVAVTVKTESVTDITGSSAISGGNIVSDGGFQVSTQGICWDTLQNPTIGEAFAIDTLALGFDKFSNDITGLKGGTTYYVRAFATNNGGISYGENEIFTTNIVPFLTTNIPSEITGNTAVSGGIVTESFGANIVATGVCWSVSINPSIKDAHTEDGSNGDPFTSQITGLLPSSTYHVRSYATTSVGETGYGDDVMFDTQIVDFDGNVYTSVKIGEITWMAQNFICTHYNDGTPIDAVDYAWHPNDVDHEYGLNYTGSAMLKSNFTPKGWHVPTNEEWGALFAYVENDGNKIKESGTEHWISDNGTNETGFTALGSAHIYGVALKTETTWWSSTVEDSGIPWRWATNDGGAIFGGPWNGPEFAFSVRLVKD